MAWTESRVGLLRKFWAEGLSASQIAKQLGGASRNAVIGKVHRLGLSGRATPARPSRRPVRSRKPTDEPAPLQPLAFSLGGGCRFPIGDPQDADFRMCGDPRHCGPYCIVHARICYVPLTKRQTASTERLVNWMDRRSFKAAAQA